MVLVPKGPGVWGHNFEMQVIKIREKDGNGGGLLLSR